MAVNSLSWFRAAQLLNIPETERGKGWHDGFSAYELALMQAPGDEEEQKVIQAALESSLSSTTARNPKNRDIGRVTGIDSHIVGAAALYPDMNSPQITLYAAQTVSDWLRNNNESPSPILASWFKSMCVDSITWSGDIQPLEPLTDEQKQDYNSRAAWTWVDAIYILQGYKPAYQLSTEQVRSHFPNWVKYFTDSLLLGAVGKETMQAGQRIFIDSPANWQAFWQSIHKTPEPKAEAVEKLSPDNELDIILVSLHDTFNELKQRNELPYDGVLGCPPDSITENEKDRFESIRNRLLDGDGLTVADIHGLINDCDANAHSFSLIPDRLKQDIRFLASLWRAAKQDKPKTEAVRDTDRMEQGIVGVDWQNDPTLTKLEKQRKAILEVIASKGFDAMAIPDCEKGTIEMLCRADYPLFFDAESSFASAWKNARHLFKMANHASFAKRGKQ